MAFLHKRLEVPSAINQFPGPEPVNSYSAAYTWPQVQARDKGEQAKTAGKGDVLTKRLSSRGQYSHHFSAFHFSIYPFLLIL